jgi:hypothetical protein
MGVISYSLIQSEGVIQLETCGEDHYLLFTQDANMRKTLICLSRATARHLAQDILNHIGLMEEKGRKEAQE